MDAINAIVEMPALGQGGSGTFASTKKPSLRGSTLPICPILIADSSSSRGEMRISSFLLWQIAYAELYVTDTLWPDFRRMEFCRSYLDYQVARGRRLSRAA